MKVSVSRVEKDIKSQDRRIAINVIKLRQVLKCDSPKLIAQTLHDCELPNRTKSRFEMIIEWEILGSDKVKFWKQVKTAYETMKVR